MMTEKDETFFSLLYPDRRSSEQSVPVMDATSMMDLAVEPIFQAMRNAVRFRPNQQHPLEHMTRDADVIRYRLDIVEDLMDHPSLFQLFVQLVPELEDMKQLYTVQQESSGDLAEELYMISEMELYIECIQRLYDYLQKEKLQLHSLGMRSFFAIIVGLAESEAFQTLKGQTEQLTTRIRNVKSMTIGINLDAQLRPVEAGLVAVNVKPYQSGHIIDKFLRADFRNDEFTCLAPLESVKKGLSSEQQARFRAAVTETLHSVMKSSIKSWKPAIRTFIAARSRFLVGLVDEIRFLVGGVSLLKQMSARQLPLCKPDIAPMTSRVSEIRGLYNPTIMLRQEEGAELAIVTNDLEFDESAMFYIMTGPNQGGKTVFAQAVGIAQMMFQLGLHVPARDAILSPVDRICTHFPNHEQGSSTHGRFGEECNRLMGIFQQLTSQSLLLMDETFSSTSAAEASHIAEQVVIALSALGCRVIFATHLHELAHRIDQLNQHPQALHRIDHLTAGLIADSVSGQRSYTITRSRPTGSSYAQSIAVKYGLTLDQMLQSIRRPV